MITIARACVRAVGRMPLAVALAVACSPNAPRSPDHLLVAAASDLAAAMPDLAAAFEEETGVRVEVTLASSGQLARQILNGAPVDVFLSADRAWVEEVRSAGRADPEHRVHYARGALALVTAAHRPPLRELEALAAAGVGRVAIANPAHAPYGVAALEALTNAGVADAVRPRLVYAENARQTLQFVASGNVDAALTARALAAAGALAWVSVPDTLYSPPLQEAVAIRGAAHDAGAARFVRFLSGDVARSILARHHFELPEQPTP